MKKLLALLVLAGLVLLSACQAAPQEGKIFRWVSSLEDNCINPHNCSTANNYEVVDLIQVSLYRWAPAGSRDKAVLVPALAEGQPESQDGQTWIIRLSPGAKWHNGEAIDAEDFIYSWRMGLDPTLYYPHGTQLASQFIEIEGALAYYSQLVPDASGALGPQVPWESVGLRALDAQTLEVRTAQVYTATDVMRHFSVRMTSPVYQPLYEAGMNEGRTATNYGTALEYFMGCGPFELTAWTKGSQRTFRRSAHFVAADTVLLDGIDCQVVTDANTRLELFQSDQSDYVALEAAGLEQYLESPLLHSYDQKTIRTLEVNRSHPGHPVLGDPDLRRALYLAIDRQALAGLTHTTPAPYFISTMAVSGEDGTAYRAMPGAADWLPQNEGYDPDAAAALYDAVLARWELGTLELTLAYSTDADNLRILSEYLQAHLPQVLGEGRLSLTLQAMPKQAALDMMKQSAKGETDAWDLCWSAWNLTAETFGPHKKFEPYRSTDSRRYTAYSNAFLDERYPELLTEAYRLDPAATFALTVEIEKSIILEDVTCIPVVQERNYVLFSPRMVHCVDFFVPQLGFGWEYMDINLG